MANREPSLKRLQQLRLAFATYTDLAEATCGMLMTFKSIPLTSKSRENFLIQKQYEDSAQAAYARARNALMVAIAIHARYAMGEALLLRSAPPEFRNAKQHKSHRQH